MQVKKGVGSNLGSIFRPANFTGSKFDPKLRLNLGFELSPSQHRHSVTSALGQKQPLCMLQILAPERLVSG